MRINVRSLLPMVAVLLTATGAFSLGTASGGLAERQTAGTLTADAVRNAFVAAGQIVGEPSPSSGGVAMLSVRDPAQGMQLRVFVYPSADAALVDHRQAHARDESTRNRSIPDSADLGPQLLTGYGLSVWRANVAIIEAAPVDDIGAYPIEPDCGLDQNDQQAILPHTNVDPRYVATLDGLLQRQ